MSQNLVHRFVWDEAGLGFFEDGVYAHDFGWIAKIADWDETCWREPGNCPMEIHNHPDPEDERK